ncbi:MAG: hypothetical protein J3Q66DRAFT_180217 [Benniella sp.]|nr:MAG: hypothetical protein J3Q66DRAFT_180217 [Benniella sp.]
MRLRHFCIGSIGTQDLLISKTFLPLGTPDEDTDIRKVWATFLDLFQNEHRWTPLHSQLHPDRHGDSPQGIGSGPKRNSNTTSTRRRSDTPVLSESASSTTMTRPQGSFGRPLFSKDCCFIYHTTNDLVLVACCPLPPTPSTASSTKTRIPLSLPGQPTPKTASAPSTASTTTLVSSPDTSPQQQQQQRPELTFSTAVGLHVSLHGMVEYLVQLVKAMERYLLHASGNGASGTETRRTSLIPPAVVNSKSSASASRSTGVSSPSASPSSLSADIVQLNTGIVYEILDECMELGYPMMPSLAQLDLLIFGVSRTA